MKRLEKIIGSSLLLLVFFLLLQGIIGCGSCVNRAQTWDKIVPDVMDSVAAIDIVDGFISDVMGKYEPLAGGTGFVVSSDGYVITNAHVVEVAKILPMLDPQIWVRFQDGRKFESVEVYADEMVDVAVIKIEVEDIPYVEFEKYKPLKVGQEIMVIGNAYPFEFTVTSGIVSNIEIYEGEEIFFQHTADTNFGCSGGPIFSKDGKVIGITVALAPNHRGVYFGISGFIAIDTIKEMVEINL